LMNVSPNCDCWANNDAPSSRTSHLRERRSRGPRSGLRRRGKRRAGDQRHRAYRRNTAVPARSSATSIPTRTGRMDLIMRNGSGSAPGNTN
jgi:hypothetical protein